MPSPKRDILLLVGHGAKLLVAGIVLGLTAAAALTRLLQNLLFVVSTIDPPTLEGVVSLLALVALLACYVSARALRKSIRWWH